MLLAKKQTHEGFPIEGKRVYLLEWGTLNANAQLSFMQCKQQQLLILVKFSQLFLY